MLPLTAYTLPVSTVGFLSEQAAKEQAITPERGQENSKPVNVAHVSDVAAHLSQYQNAAWTATNHSDPVQRHRMITLARYGMRRMVSACRAITMNAAKRPPHITVKLTV